MDYKHNDAIDEKGPRIDEAPSSPPLQKPLQGHDKAYDYLQSHNAGSSPIDLKALRRKIDWRIVPLMFCCYTMQFLDKVILNYAAVMGINAELKLKGNDFTNAATAFFIAYLIAEVPNGILPVAHITCLALN